LLLSGSALAQEKEAASRKFRPVNIEAGRFTHDRVGLLHLECEKNATFLAVWVWKNLKDGIRESRADARVKARRYLALALHMDPNNSAALRINELLAGNKDLEEDLTLPQEPKLFVESIVSMAKRLTESGKPEEKMLAGFLCLVGAEIDPANEDVVYTAELFARDHESLAQEWKALAFGKRSRSE
jgi:hypothetical protein